MSSEEAASKADNPPIASCCMVVAIDFGTTFSGYAFSFSTSKTDIYMYTSWGTCVGIPVSFKAPTCVLTKKNGDFVAFGYDAQYKYSSLMSDETGNYHFYEKFKMNLHKKSLDRRIQVRSNTGHSCMALDIFGMVIRYLKDHVLGTIKKQTGGTPSKDSIQWVVTVPAIWSDGSKQFMREAVFKAGITDSINSNQLTIALEPEAASLFCRQSDLQLYSSSQSECASKLTAGTKYLVLDCGGGTLDVTAHELLKDSKISELYHANGGNLGGTQVDAKFVQLLEDIFGRNVIKSFRRDSPTDWLQMMVNFERVKRSMDPKDESHRTSLPISFVFAECYQTNARKSIKDCISDTDKKKGIAFNNGMLRLPYDVMAKVFNTVVTGIVQHVRDLLQKPVLRDISYVLLVGGFGESLLLQEALKESLPDQAKLLVPASASQCVLKGAVLFGHNPGDIAERVVQKTYGMAVYMNFNPDVHRPDKTVMKDGIKMAYPVFSKYVTRGDKVKTGRKKSFTYKTFSASQAIGGGIYDTDDKNPKYTDDEGVVKVGRLSLALPGTGTDREVVYDITFGSTELEVEAKDPRPGGAVAKTSIDFLTH